MKKPSRTVAAALFGAALLCAGPLHAQARPPPSETATTEVASVNTPTTVRHPLSLTLGVGFPDAANVSLAYNLNRMLALEAGYGTAGFYKDYGLHARLFPFHTHRFHTYLQGGVDVMDMSPISPDAPKVLLSSLRIGEEFRAENGFTVGLNLGAGLPLTGPERPIVPTGRLYIGWSF